jgi:hypothetical protein
MSVSPIEIIPGRFVCLDLVDGPDAKLKFPFKDFAAKLDLALFNSRRHLETE